MREAPFGVKFICVLCPLSVPLQPQGWYATYLKLSQERFKYDQLLLNVMWEVGLVSQADRAQFVS